MGTRETRRHLGWLLGLLWLSCGAPLGAQPQAGNWAGTTTQGRPYTFTVQTGGASINPLSFGWACSGPGTTASGTTTINGTLPISGNQFALSGPGCPSYSTSGTFTSPNAASGALTLTWVFNGTTCLCSGTSNLTWTATRTLPQADLTLTNSNGVSATIPGQFTTYVIVVRNLGPTNVVGASVSDVAPAILSLVSWNCVASAGSSCTPGPVNGNLADTVNVLAGGTLTYNLTGLVDGSATGSLTNTASVTAPGTVTDPNPSNNTASDVDTLTPRADLSVIQSVTPDPAPPSSYVTYGLTVANNGPSQASGISLSDTLPAGLAFVSSLPGAPTCQHASGVVTCALGTLPPGVSTQVGVSASIRAGTVGAVQNVATVSSATTDPVGSNNVSTATTSVSAFTKGDMGTDGRTDLLFFNFATGRNLVWFMDGMTRTAEAYVVPDPTGASWQIAGTDDFNADLRNDLVFWNTLTGQVEFWMMNSVNRVGAPVPLTGAPPLDPSWKLSATADFNHDGRPDLVFRNFTTQKIVVWLMSGTVVTGTLVPNPDQAVNFNWEIVGTLDWNDDGNTDFLWYNFSSGKIVLWFMDANGTRLLGQFTEPPNAGNNNWKVLAVGDYGPGLGGLANTKDIVWRNATSGRLVLWWMDRAGNRTFAAFTVPDAPANPLDWTIVGPR